MSVEEAVAAAEQAARAALRGQGADPCRRARQGQVQGTRPRRQGRRAAGAHAPTRSAPARDRDARQHAGHRSRPAPAGKQVNRLYVTDGVDIAKEFYLALLVDREERAGSPWSSRPRAAWTSRTSPTTRPRRSTRFAVDPATGFMPHHGRAVAYALEPRGRPRQAGAEASRSSSTTPSSAPTPRRSRSTRSP